MTYEGRYWLDAQGNLGIEGGPVIANLFQAAQAAGGGGGQGGVTGTTGGTGMTGVTGDGGAVFMKRLPSGKMLSWNN